MRIFYPYNEILPKKKAHDVFIFQECNALAEASLEVTLLCGNGSLSDRMLFQHYGVDHHKLFRVKRLPIVRKNNLINLSWNWPFFFSCQCAIKHRQPDWVFLSVRKQGSYHLKNKIKQVRYLYEVHELAYYPNGTKLPSFVQEREMLSHADLITVTTNALKEILQGPPYALSVPIEVVPLAVNQPALAPAPAKKEALIVLYSGQLYSGQGLPTLLKACAAAQQIDLKIVGGHQEEIDELKKLAEKLGIGARVEWLGFQPPASLPKIVSSAHVFVAPFENAGRMPYVAHTKLYEYAEWGRPFIAPNLPCVREHFSEKEGVLLFEPGNVESLAGCLQALQNDEMRREMERRVKALRGSFSWQARAERYCSFL